MVSSADHILNAGVIANIFLGSVVRLTQAKAICTASSQACILVGVCSAVHRINKNETRGEAASKSE
jgi:hypothetical protein